MDLQTILLLVTSGIVGIIISYLVTVFILFRIIVPNLGFWKSSLPQKIPAELAEVVESMKRQTKNDYDFLWSTYNYVTGKYDGQQENFRDIITKHFWSLDKIWPRHDYTPATQQNLIIRLMLIKSGYFKDENIQVNNVFLNYYSHQYLIVNTSRGPIEIDPAFDYKGIKFGKHAKGFM